MRALEVIQQLVLVGEASKRAVSDLGPRSLNCGRHGIVAHLGARHSSSSGVSLERSSDMGTRLDQPPVTKATTT